MSYTQWKDGYAKETSFKDGTTIDGAGDTAYKIGAIHQDSEWPSPEFEPMFNPVGVNAHEVTAGNLWKSQGTLRGVIYFIPQNGISLWMAMGKSSTAGADPYTHTITPTTDGTVLPSFAFQHEEKGTATDEEYQFQGVKVDSLTLSHNLEKPNVLVAKMEIMAGYALDPGFALTNDPALPATANSNAYQSLTRTWDYGAGNTAIDGLRSIDISIINGLSPLYAHSWDTGVYTGHWPYALIEAARKEYIITMSISKNTIERALWTELLSLSNTKEAYFKWTRSANDYIAVTATDCQVTKHDIITPAGAKREDIVGVTLIPRALSIEVKDSIIGTVNYGE